MRVLSGVLAGAALIAGVLGSGVPAHADLPFGPFTCKAGFVWREAVAGDVVCVTPEVRRDTQIENSDAPRNVDPARAPFCKQGFVWRETRPSDLVCVVPNRRDQAYSDNANAPFRLVDPGATPRGGVSILTELHQTGGFVWAGGGGLSANGVVRFYAVGINTTGPFSLGWLTTDSAGNLVGRPGFWQFVADVSCRSGQTGPGIIVVLDQRTGGVATAGTTDAFRHCG